MTDHDCQFPEIEIDETDEDEEGNLRAGMKVLTSCRSCGATPLEDLEFYHRHTEELQAALLACQPKNLPLYHWSPRARRNLILRYGLRPNMRPTTSDVPAVSGGVPCICLADSPSWAWALSGAMPYTPDGEWDLWQVWLDRITEPIVLASDERPSGLYEVRTEHRIYKRDLWHVGSRSC